MEVLVATAIGREPSVSNARNQPMKKSTKINVYASVFASASTPAIMLYKLMPGATAMQSLWVISKSIGAWVVVGLVVFAMNWIFFGGLYLLGRWIYNSFYRTPTL